MATARNRVYRRGIEWCWYVVMLRVLPLPLGVIQVLVFEPFTVSSRNSTDCIRRVERKCLHADGSSCSLGPIYFCEHTIASPIKGFPITKPSTSDPIRFRLTSVQRHTHAQREGGGSHPQQASIFSAARKGLTWANKLVLRPIGRLWTRVATAGQFAERERLKTSVRSGVLDGGGRQWCLNVVLVEVVRQIAAT